MQAKTREDFLRSLFTQHLHSLHSASFYYQVTYCETRYSHRTVNLEVDPDQQQEFLATFKQFQEEIHIIDHDVVAVKLQELPAHAIQACRIIADKDKAEQNLLQADESHSDAISYCLLIVSTMHDATETFKEWQKQQANLTKSKSIYVDNLFEKSTETGSRLY
jgi:hypothetical protein